MAHRLQGKLAVEESYRSLTYDELDSYAEQIAKALSAPGNVENTIVAIHLEASCDYVAAVLGILKAGAAFLPLSPRLPESMVRSILSKARPSCFISNLSPGDDPHGKSQWSFLSPAAQDLLTLTEIARLPRGSLSGRGITVYSAQTAADRFTARVLPPDSCYLMTTSGSTGKPKLILGSHQGLAHFIGWEISEFALDESHRVSLLSPLTFDVSLRDIFVPLITGGTLCIPDEESRHNPRALANWLSQQHITLTHMVPSVLRSMTRELERDHSAGDLLPDLRYVLLAGEPLYGGDILRWRNLAGQFTELVNLYGPSETTLAKLFFRIDNRPFGPSEMVPIGRPIWDTEALIIRDGHLCDIGEIGEIYIETAFMSKGYLDDPALNETSFVQCPVPSTGEHIVYRTGDLGEWLPDGMVRFVGRRDDQIKLHGKRLELGAIEAVLRLHPDLREVIVDARKDRFDNLRLVAYFVPEDKGQQPTESLRRFAERNLPDYMIPSLFVPLKDLPRSHNRKPNRGALPDPPKTRPEMERPYISPGTALEKAIAEEWRYVLDIDRVGVEDDFFDLGGTSLLAAELIMRLRAKLGIHVPITRIFQHANIRALTESFNRPESEPADYGDLQSRARLRRAVFSRHARVCSRS